MLVQRIIWALCHPPRDHAREYWNHNRLGPSESDHRKDEERRVDDEDSEGQQMIDREIENY